MVTIHLNATTWSNKLRPSLDRESYNDSSVKKRTDNNLPIEQAGKRNDEHPKPPLRDIKMIIGGTTTSSLTRKAWKTYLKMVQNIQLARFVLKMARVDNPIVRFSEEDAWRLHHPHNDALVITIRVADYNTHWVLVDNGSSADILYYLEFQQIRIEKERLILSNVPLVGFGGTKYIPLRQLHYM